MSPNTLLKNNLFAKKRRRNSKFFYQNHGLTPANLVTFLYPSFYGQERQLFYLESSQTPFLGQISLKRDNKQISTF